MKKLFLFTLLFVLATTTFAQIGAGRQYPYDTDTLTNTDTLTLEFNKRLDDDYQYTHQISIDTLSGTTDVTVLLQERLHTSQEWATRDTLMFTTKESKMFTGVNNGIYQRFLVLSSGTQSTQIDIYSWYRRRKI